MLAKTMNTLPTHKLGRIRLLMQKYISQILVESVLGKALADCGHQREEHLTEADIEALVEECMVGLRLFVAADRLPELMLALTDILMEPTDEEPAGTAQPRTLSGTYRSRVQVR